MVRRTRILLLLSHLGGGGAEHVVALLARDLSKEKYEVHLGLVGRAAGSGESLPLWVSVHALNVRRARAAAFPLLRLIWRIRPTVVLSGAVEVSLLVLMLRPLFPPKTSVLVRQNATASSVLAFGSLPRFTRLVYRLLYRHSDHVICQSQAMAKDLARAAGIGEEQIAVLPNPVDLKGIRAAMRAPVARSSSAPQLLAIGRLSREKGFDLLLRAMVAVREQFPKVSLILAGAGQEETALKSLSSELGLETAVCFAGYVDRPYALLPEATLFVLPSRHEGMPNALLEAAAAGLPLVATPASGGIVDLLRGRPGAWLAPEISAESLAATIIAALKAIRPGQRFSHDFLPSNAPIARQTMVGCHDGVRIRPACNTAGTAARSTSKPAMRAALPSRPPRSREYSHGIAKAKRRSRIHAVLLIVTSLIALRINQGGVDGDANRGLDGGFQGSVQQILRFGVGNVENVAVLHRLVGILAAQHAPDIEGDHGAASFLLANEEGFADGGVLRRPPGERERLHHGEPLNGIDRESTGPNYIAHHVDQAGAAHLDRVAGAELWIVVGGCIGSAGVKHHPVRRLGIAVVEDIDQPPGI
jgi:glycosyltransferase involved in cell wall biosynthesis